MTNDDISNIFHNAFSMEEDIADIIHNFKKTAELARIQ